MIMNSENRARERVLLLIKSTGLNCSLSIDICQKLESACYSYCIYLCNQDSCHDQFIQRYSEITGNIIMNLDPLSSVNRGIKEENRLYTRIKNGLSIHEIPKMECHQLNPECSAADRILLDKKLNSGIVKNYLDIPCKNCKEKMLFERKIQTRSGDEPADLLHECDNCTQIFRL